MKEFAHTQIINSRQNNQWVVPLKVQLKEAEQWSWKFEYENELHDTIETLYRELNVTAGIQYITSSTQ